MLLGVEITLRIKLTERPEKCISIPGNDQRFCPSPKRPDWFSSTNIFLFKGVLWGKLFSPGVKHPEREADHAPAASAVVKNEWSYIFSLPRSCHEARSDLNPFQSNFSANRILPSSHIPAIFLQAKPREYNARSPVHIKIHGLP